MRSGSHFPVSVVTYFRSPLGLSFITCKVKQMEGEVLSSSKNLAFSDTRLFHTKRNSPKPHLMLKCVAENAAIAVFQLIFIVMFS